MLKLIVSIITVTLLLGAAGSSFAEENSAKENESQKTKETVAMSQAVYEDLTEIQELIEAKDYASAQRLIDGIKGKKGLSPYELAQIWNISGYSYYLQEDYVQAIKAYNQVMAQPDLPEALLQSTLSIEGYCVVQYVVTKNGTIRDPFVVEGQCTSSLFEQASIQAALKFKYKPRVMDGQAVEVPGVQNKFTYEIQE